MTAWACVQIGDLLRRAGDEVRHATTALDLDPVYVSPDLEHTIPGAEADQLKRMLLGIAELGEHLEHLAEKLPADDDIRITGDDISTEAAEDLANGILDPNRALLAAEILGRQAGLGALSNALLRSEAHAAWTEVTVEDLLSRFRGVDPLLVREILSDTRLAPSVSFADLDAADAARLAAALAHFADTDVGG